MISGNNKQVSEKYAFLHLGFRPFFIGATGFAFLSTLLWMGIYGLGWTLQLKHFAPITWHAHEMVFGYSTAVIAGFLLTAEKNWTGIQTLSGYPLLSLFLIWIAARLLPFFNGIVSIELVALMDNLFIIFLSFAVAGPLLKVRQWRNIGMVVILLLLLASNVVFYLGLLGIFSNGISTGLYSGLYLILTLVFIMGRRVIPFFIERGVGYPVKLINWKWIDVSSLVIFLLFWIADLITVSSTLAAVLAALLFFIHGIRLFGWHTSGIWKKPLLWILYLGYGWIVLGFALKAVGVVYAISPYLAVHAFAFGGIGMMTLGMMARVSLGHTGRNVHDPPRILNVIFMTLFCGALVRIIFPLFDSSLYASWVALSQILWMGAFGMFLFICFPILIYPRIDGRFG
jgi:uncharacterized protein involved in response to NO